MAEHDVVLNLSVKTAGNIGAPLQQLGQAAQQANQQRQRLQQGQQAQRQQSQQQSQAAAHLGLSALSGNVGGMGTGMAGLAMGLGPAAAATAAFAAVGIGAGKTAQALDILGNSTLSAGQKQDKLAAEFIPLAGQFIALRKSLSGLPDALRQIGIAHQFAQIGIRGQSEVERATLARNAEMRVYDNAAREYGGYARRLVDHPPEGAIMPRGTVAEEIAFQNRQRLLPHQYAQGRAQAEAGAARSTFEQSKAAALKLQADLDTLRNRRDTQKERLEGLREGRIRPPGGWDQDSTQKEINRQGTAAEQTILAIEEKRVKLEQALNIAKQAGLSMVEKEAVARRAGIGAAQAELSNLQAKEQRSAGMAFTIGSMSPADRMRTQLALGMAQKAGLSNLPPALKRSVESFLPEYAQKEYEKTAPKTDLWRRATALAGKEFIDEKGDFAGLRKQIQEKAANVEVKIILNEEQTAQAIARHVGPALNKLIEAASVKIEDERKKQQTGNIIRNANQ